MKISFVIPCYRSERTVTAVCDELIQKMREKPEYRYEIICVNDCSPDGVYGVIRDLAKKNPLIKAIDLAKNVGKHSALMAGFRYSTGDIVICLDDDGQCPVDHLWELIAPLSNGADVSMAQYGVKKQSKFKNFGSWMNAWMMTNMLGKPKELQFANFTAMKRFVINEMLRYEHSYTYLNGLILRTTKNIVNVPMEERERTVGTSGYTFFKSLNLWINGYTAFSVMPLRLAMILGIISCVVSAVFAVAALVGAFIPGSAWVSTVLILFGVFFVGGLVMLTNGLLGEYVGRVYMCMNNAPQYVIREIVDEME